MSSTRQQAASWDPTQISLMKLVRGCGVMSWTGMNIISSLRGRRLFIFVGRRKYGYEAASPNPGKFCQHGMNTDVFFFLQSGHPSGEEVDWVFGDFLWGFVSWWGKINV